MITTLIGTLLIIAAGYVAVAVAGIVVIRCVFALTEPLDLPPGERRHTRQVL